MNRRNSSISDRHTSEKMFHNKKYTDRINYPRHYMLNPTYVIFNEMKNMLGDIREKRILEYGCGEGWTTIELARLGGKIDSFDISSVAVDHARKRLVNQGVESHCTIRIMAAENLEYPDNCFNIVIGFAILHHLDLSLTLPEMYRVMRKGSVAYFAEPLGSNPIINLYRKLTPQYRTMNETPLIMRDFQKTVSSFAKFQHREYFFTALLPLGLSYIRMPNALVQNLIRVFYRFDNVILDRFPSMGRFAWYSIIRLEK